MIDKFYEILYLVLKIKKKYSENTTARMSKNVCISKNVFKNGIELLAIKTIGHQI